MRAASVLVFGCVVVHIDRLIVGADGVCVRLAADRKVSRRVDSVTSIVFCAVGDDDDRTAVLAVVRDDRLGNAGRSHITVGGVVFVVDEEAVCPSVVFDNCLRRFRGGKFVVDIGDLRDIEDEAVFVGKRITRVHCGLVCFGLIIVDNDLIDIEVAAVLAEESGLEAELAVGLLEDDGAGRIGSVQAEVLDFGIFMTRLRSHRVAVVGVSVRADSRDIGLLLDRGNVIFPIDGRAVVCIHQALDADESFAAVRRAGSCNDIHEGNVALDSLVSSIDLLLAVIGAVDLRFAVCPGSSDRGNLEINVAVLRIGRLTANRADTVCAAGSIRLFAVRALAVGLVAAGVGANENVTAGHGLGRDAFCHNGRAVFVLHVIRFGELALFEGTDDPLMTGRFLDRAAIGADRSDLFGRTCTRSLHLRRRERDQLRRRPQGSCHPNGRC